MSEKIAESAERQPVAGGVRYDKFSVGDSVTWADDRYAALVGGRDRLGPGPFQISEVIDREFVPNDDQQGQSNWASMGHTQHVYLAGDADETMWSGAYFRTASAEAAQ